MTERERDDRDLQILTDYDSGLDVRELCSRHDVEEWYIFKLLEDYNNGTE